MTDEQKSKGCLVINLLKIVVLGIRKSISGTGKITCEDEDLLETEKIRWVKEGQCA